MLIDRESIDVRYLEQLSESGQTTALAYMMGWILDHVTKEEDIQEFIENMYKLIEKKGMVAVIPANYSAGHPFFQESRNCMPVLAGTEVPKS